MTDVLDRPPSATPSPPDSPAPPSVRRAVGRRTDSPVHVVAAACSIGAGALHIGASQTHLEHLTLSRLILLAGTAQLLVGVALLRNGDRRLAMAAGLVNAAVVAGWLLTRLVDIGWVEGLEVAESPQAADSITGLLGLGALVAAVASVRSRRGGGARTLASPTSRLVTSLTVVAVLGIGLYGANEIGAHDHDHGPSEEIAAGAWQIGATEAEVDDTWDLVRSTQEAVAAYPTVAAAEADGFVRINDDHLLRVDRVFDDKQLDPAAIESLVVGQRDGEDFIRGGMYLMDINQTMRDVPRIGGPLMVWHSHGGFCFRANGVIEAGPEAGGTCPDETIWLDDPPMVHIYNDPQADGEVLRTEGNCGTFAYMDPPFDEPVPGCAGTNDGHAGHAHG